MSNASAASSRFPFLRTARRFLARIGLVATSTVAFGLVSPHAARAQASTPESPAPQARRWEARVASGAFVPTGDHRLFLRHARVHAAQASWLLRPRLAVAGTFAWARSRDLASVGTTKLDVFTYDVGIEARSTERLPDRPVGFRLFAGLGAGARSYNHRGLDTEATTNPAGYGSVGGELGIRRMALRLEVRSYLAGFKPLIGSGRAELRNDLAVMVTLGLNRRYVAPE